MTLRRIRMPNADPEFVKVIESVVISTNDQRPTTNG
jgi:hypothetical protein